MAFKILSIDGGGTRGIIPARILERIEQEFDTPAQNLFDLFAGTSTGGIICLGLSAGLSPNVMAKLYLSQAPQIFRESFFDRMSGMDEHLRANYQHKQLKEILEQLFQERTLGHIHNQRWFGQQGKEVMICSFDLNPEDQGDRNRNYRPMVFHSAFQRDQEEKLVDLALRTSSGPTYFPIYQKKYIDGGVAMNNPSMSAIAYAVNQNFAREDEIDQYLINGRKGLALKLSDIKVLSLGTGTSNLNRIEPATIRSGNWGNLQWIKYLPELLTEGNVQSSIYYARSVLAEGHFLRIDPSFDDDSITVKPLKNRRIPMTTIDPELLWAMREVADNIFDQYRDRIRDFLL